MRSLLRFLSLTTLGQLCALVNQLVLLPLELRIWGTAMAAQWFVVLSTANLIVISDLGLRSSGHADLLKATAGDPEATRAFRAIWALTRLMIGLGTLLFLVYFTLTDVAGAPLLLSLVITASLGCDTLTTTRGVWLDTLDQFNSVELAYLGTQAARILLSFVALLGFRAPPMMLAWILLITSFGWLIAQGLLSRSPLLAYGAGGFRTPRWRSLRDIPFVITDPASSWIRLSLPVVVFAGFMPAAFITTYVAVRAAFGAARLAAMQLARYASVQYARQGRGDSQQTVAVRAIFATTALGMVVASVAIVDNGRLLRTWLGAPHVQDSRAIVACFAAGALTFGYQVPAGILVRLGHMVDFAKRQYVYISLGLLAALLVPFLPAAAPVYLTVLAGLEILNAALFAWALGPAVRNALVQVFALSLGVLLALGAVVTYDPWTVFTGHDITAVVWSAMAGALAVAGVTIPLLISPQAKLRFAIKGA